MNADTIIYLIVNAVRIWTSIRLLSVFLYKSRKPAFIMILGCIYWIANSYSYLAMDKIWINALTNISGLLVIVIFGFEGTIISKILVSALDMGIGVAAENISLVLLSNKESSIHPYTNMMSAFIFLTIMIILDRTIRSVKGSIVYIMHSVIMIIVSAALSFVGCLIVVNTSELATGAVLCILMLVSFMIFYLFDALRNDYIREKEEGMYKLQLDMYRNQLRILQSTDEATRILRHDMKHHIMMLNEYIDSDNIEKIKPYLSSMVNSVEKAYAFADTGDSTVDSILNYYAGRMESVGGHIDMDISLYENISADTYDINVILSNLLSNALEAVEKTETPQIYLFMKYNRGILNIEISNPFIGSTVKKNNMFMSTKADSSEHGIGLISVNHIVEKYHGFMCISDENNSFKVSIVLYT